MSIAGDIGPAICCSVRENATPKLRKPDSTTAYQITLFRIERKVI
jgi:hypothetical protein